MVGREALHVSGGGQGPGHPTTTLPSDRQAHCTARRRTHTHHRQGVREGRLAVEERAPSLGSLHLRAHGERRRFSRGQGTRPAQRGSAGATKNAPPHCWTEIAPPHCWPEARARCAVTSSRATPLRICGSRGGGEGEREDRGTTRQPRTADTRSPTRRPARPAPARPDARQHRCTPCLPAHGKLPLLTFWASTVPY